MKKVVLFTIILMFIFSGSVFAKEIAPMQERPENPTERIEFDEKLIEKEPVLYSPFVELSLPLERLKGEEVVPLREVAEHFGYRVDYIHLTKSIILTKDEKVIECEVGDKKIIVSDESVIVDLPLVIKENKVYVSKVFTNQVLLLNFGIKNESILVSNKDPYLEDFPTIIDDLLEISLEENASTGYLWHYEILDETVTSLFMDFVSDNSNNQIVGAPVNHTYVFNGLKEGETTITFSYNRNFGDTTPIKQIQYIIQVEKDENGYFIPSIINELTVK